jgi:4-amino-4-deoxy-L-arabinose transferase
VANNTQQPARAAFAGAVVAALITIPGLGSGTLWDNSETAYGEVAREILITHNWTIMHFNLVPYFVQPPLYFWLAAIFSMLFGGPSSFALRFPSALATIALAGMTGYAVARQAGTRVGIYASVILSSCLMMPVIGRLAIMDALLDMTVAMTVFWWFRGLETGRDRYFVYGWAAAGVGFLAKGLVAPVVALLVIVPFYFWNRRHEPTFAPSLRAWLMSTAAFLVIALPWPVALAAHYGFFPLEKLFGQYTFGRYTGVIENQAGPVWYYLPVLVLGFFPWIAFLPMSLVYAARQLRATGDPSGSRLVRLAVAWIVTPLVFFSFARTKLPNYIALEFPALALLTALYFEEVVRRGGTRSAIVSASSVPVTIGLVAIACVLFARNNAFGAQLANVEPGLIGLGVAIFAGSLLTALLIARGGTVGFAPYALAIATLVAMDVVATVALPQVEAYKPIPRLAAIIQRDRRPYDAVAIQSISGGNALLFYTHPEVKVLAPPGDGIAEGDGIDPRVAICGSPRAWVVAPKKRPAFDPTYGRERHLVATDIKAALFLYDGPLCRESPG